MLECINHFVNKSTDCSIRYPIKFFIHKLPIMLHAFRDLLWSKYYAAIIGDALHACIRMCSVNI